jgi:hypothetical protein
MNMNNFKRMAVLAVALMGVGLALPAAAQSHGGHQGGRVGAAHAGAWRGDGGWHRGGGPGWWGIGLGLGLGWEAATVLDPYAYPYPGYVYAPPAVVAEPSAPPLDAAPSNPPPSSNWYYCDSAKGYYPYVKECPEGWRPVPATPAEPGQ